jgi:hypothetical protein
VFSGQKDRADSDSDAGGGIDEGQPEHARAVSCFSWRLSRGKKEA